MYAVIRTGGKQYRVSKDDVIEIERLEGKVGDKVKSGECKALLLGGKTRHPDCDSNTSCCRRTAKQVPHYGSGERLIAICKGCKKMP